jgi:DNA-directed RNA polymerase specialized sigma24 family protein
MGFTYNEISDITGYPVNTIKSNVLRAKTMLHDELKGTIAEDYHEL